MTTRRQVTVTVLAGLDDDVIARVAGALSHRPRSVTIRYGVLAAGDTPVLSRDMGGTEDLLGTSHGCLGCAIRDDILDVLVDLVEGGERVHVSRALVVLPAGLEPSCVVDALDMSSWVDGSRATTWLPIDAVIVALDADRIEDSVSTDEDLATAGISAGAYGGRLLAEVALAQLATADIVSVFGLGLSEESGTRRVKALLAHLAPDATLVRGQMSFVLEAALARVPHDPVRTGMRHENVGVPRRVVMSEAGVSSMFWSSRRPLHPRRFFDLLQSVAAQTIHVQGHVWLATRPHEVLRVDISGGGVAVTGVDAWLADAPESSWEGVSPHRRTHASLGWDPYYGDRGHELHITTASEGPEDPHASAIGELFASALVDDTELAGGYETWVELEDPFTPWLGEPWSRHPGHAANDPCDGVRGAAHEQHPMTNERTES